MPNKDRSFHEPLPKPGGEGWLYSEQQQPEIRFAEIVLPENKSSLVAIDKLNEILVGLIARQEFSRQTQKNCLVRSLFGLQGHPLGKPWPILYC